MAKVALLIGVSEYEPGLTPLPAAIKDVEAMQRVLENPEIGGFDDVTPLINPRRQAMEEAIETLFAGRQKDDLVLLFFSGHGIKDEGGKLYFATRNTRKNEKGGLVQATAVSANFVQEIMRTKGFSKRQVVILDCCFSGAFAEDMLIKDDGSVDVKNQLGGQGRAVLTSSTSTQYSFEQKESNLSIYTRYLVEGIETGAADTNDNGVITVDELHEYARKKVREAAPTMSPEIYPIREGYTIVLAKAPLGDPKLKYRKEVERFSRGGEISSIGRKALEQLQVKLKLSSEIAIAIENEALQPYRDYQKRLQEYEQVLEEAQKNLTLNSDAQDDLQRFQQILGLRDEDIAPIITKLNTKNRVDENPPRPRNRNFPYYIEACIIGVIGVFLGGTLVYFFRPIPNPPQSVVQSPLKSCADKEQYSSGDGISLGEEILLKQYYTNSDSNKQTGVQAFASGDCQTAIDQFNSYRKINLRNPEALIYLNNAKARQTGKWLKIAVSVPINTNQDSAEEILRGVAQAQDEVNNDKKGINGKVLLVVIANDDEKRGSSEKIAKALVEDQEVLGVVGAVSSNATLEAGNVYNTEGLVAISPTSTSVEISKFSPYIFRTVFSDKVAAEKLANYMMKNLQKKKAAVFFVFGSYYSRPLKEKFVEYVQKQSQNKILSEFDLSKRDFNAETAVEKAIQEGAEVLMLASTTETLDNAYQVIKANNNNLNILAGDNIFRQKTLKPWGKQAEGMVVAIPWHIGNASNSKFVNNSKELWQAQVNWRTATAYDATLAIAKGLEQSNTREGLKQVLHSPNFSVDGATGKIQFSSGDRKDNPIVLVQVKQIPGTDKYDFVPIQP
ncbi:MAG: ABC transporter substrate-binding protein [Nostoc sp. DcaGUA01]|nr:ABC transporter substrate-binding protein [Nostoc sp. DcaGUA01]